MRNSQMSYLAGLITMLTGGLVTNILASIGLGLIGLLFLLLYYIENNNESRQDKLEKIKQDMIFKINFNNWNKLHQEIKELKISEKPRRRK